MSLYLLAEAGSLLSAGATMSVFSGSDASPAFMPTLPWMLPTRNTPPYLPTPPIATRIAPGTPRPPSPYRMSEAGALDSSHAGAMDPSTFSSLWASWQGEVQAAQAHGQPIPEPPPDLYAAMTPEQRAAASQASQTSYFRGQSPGTGTYTMAMRPPPAATAPADTPQTITTPAPLLFGRPAPSSPPTFDTAPSPTAGGGGAGASPTPWGALAAGGALLALLYFGRKKRR